MLRILVHNWWLLILRGAFALALAIFVFFAQTVKLTWLLHAVAVASVVEFFGLFAFGAGIVTIAAALRSLGQESEWWLLLVDGIGACCAGAAAIALPGLAFVALVHLIGGWALFVGGCELLIAQKLRRHVPDEWFLALAAAGSVAFGFYLFLGRMAQSRQLLAWLGFYALFSAVTMLALGLRLHKLRNLAHLSAKHATSQHN